MATGGAESIVGAAMQVFGKARPMSLCIVSKVLPAMLHDRAPSKLAKHRYDVWTASTWIYISCIGRETILL